jgi:methylglutaconyl-CoA hydratase
MRDYEQLRRTDEGVVATVALARPDSHNALNAALISELTDCFESLSEDENVRGIVLTGEGRSFCAGADIRYMRDTAGFTYEENLQDARRLATMFRAVHECPKPVVARVRGAAIGGGVGLVAASDVVVAEAGATFAFSEVRLGIAPATIAPFVVSKIGYSHARALMLSGERFDAELAREMGLVHEVAPEDELDTVVDRKVSQLLKGGPDALAAVKQLLRQIEAVEPMEATGLMATLISDLRVSEEGQEGLAAFLEKREPFWRKEP